MKEQMEKNSRYGMKIKIAINAIKSKDYALALISVKEAGMENQNLPEYHNLLGVIAERCEDTSLACKHYRAAYALDPSYKPALNNIERVTHIRFGSCEGDPDLGEDYGTESAPPSLFLFDLINFRGRKNRG